MPYTNVTPSKYSKLSGQALIDAKISDAINKKPRMSATLLPRNANQHGELLSRRQINNEFFKRMTAKGTRKGGKTKKARKTKKAKRTKKAKKSRKSRKSKK